MKKIQTIVLLLSVSFAVFAQTKEETIYFDNIVRKAIATPLPKGAKHKVISFSGNGYSISCDLLKNMPVEGRMMEIYDGGNVALQGVYSVIDGKSVVCGKYNYEYNDSPVSVYGTFYVSNGADILIMKPRKASELSIMEHYVDIRSGLYLGCPCLLENQGINYRLYINASLGGWDYSEFSTEIPATIVALYGHDSIDSLLLSDILDVKIKWRNGIEFSGNAIGYKDDSEVVKFTLLDGEKRYLLSGKTITVDKNLSAVGRYSFTLKNSKDNDISKEIISLPVSMEHIDIDSLWSKSYYLAHSPEIFIEYSNGDMYSGNFVVKDGKAVITTGTYTYKNGDKFVGDLAGEYLGNIPIDGETIFNGGAVKKGNWLKEYSLSDSQFTSLSKEKYVPTVIRNKAVAMVNDNKFNKFVQVAEKYEQDGDLEEAKELYQQALACKSNSTVSAKIRVIEDKIYRQELTKKYGKKYADNIMNRVIEVGMTKEMCELVVNKIIGIDFYRVSTWTNFVGDEMETWEFDYEYGIEKENQRRLKEDLENNDKSAFITYQFMNALGNYTSRAASDLTEYKYLKFRNSVLIELKDSNFYDDMNNAQREAEDALNSLYWLFGE